MGGESFGWNGKPNPALARSDAPLRRALDGFNLRGSEESSRARVSGRPGETENARLMRFQAGGAVHRLTVGLRVDVIDPDGIAVVPVVDKSTPGVESGTAPRHEQ